MQELGLVKHAGPDRSLDASWGETKASGFREPTALRLRLPCNQCEASGVLSRLLVRRGDHRA